MSVTHYVFEAGTYYIGKSVNGIMTRPFLNEGEAIAEEKWLDDLWQRSLKFWQAYQDDIAQDIEDCALETMLQVMTETKRGMRPLSSSDIPSSNRLYRSDGPEDAISMISVFEGEDFIGCFNGKSYTYIAEEMNQYRI